MNTLDAIKNLVSENFQAVEHLISSRLSQEIPLIDQLSHHLINGGGKRLRPLIVLLSAEICRYHGDKQIVLAAAVEYFHTATLLHDDVVDESSLRRGRETANTIWGSKTSILVGDYLFTQCFRWMLDTKNMKALDLFAGIAYEISRGEIKQLTLRHNANVEISDYFEVIRSKTALLFSASAELGACVAEGSEAIREALRNYGLHLGNAFQMVDDALDYSSSADVMGKNIGDDLADGKMTLPLFCAIHRGTKEQALIVKECIQNGSLTRLPEILKIVEETKAIDYTYELANKEVNKAIAALSVFEDSPYKEGLVALACFAISRAH